MLLIWKIIFHARPAWLALFLKKFLNPKPMIVEFMGSKMLLDPISALGQSIISNKDYEHDMFALIAKYLKSEQVFIDVGANEGIFTLFTSKIVGPRGRVIAFEPEPSIYNNLVLNIEINSLQNVETEKCALGSTNGVQKFFTYSSLNRGASSFIPISKRHYSACEVPVIRYERWFKTRDLGFVNLVKVDIEGWEYQFLKGMGEFLNPSHIGVLIIELHPHQLELLGDSVDQISDILDRAGYSLEHSHRRVVAK